MAVASSRGRGELPKQWKERTASPERTKVWIEPKQRSLPRRVPVVYYICRNGQLEHPHFMEVPLSSSDGLFLKDVVIRLNVLRGKGMANMYSWSSKRSYKNGYVWHDLTEDDLILPAHGNEYVLKGSELLYPELIPISGDNNSSSTSSYEKPLEISRNNPSRRTSWGGSLDLNEYKVYKTTAPAEIDGRAADAATQTEDRRPPPRRRPPEHTDSPPPLPAELGSEEISPPPSSSSPDTLETLVKPNGRDVVHSRPLDEADRTVGSIAGGRMRASAVLMQLISCGSMSMKDNNGGYRSPPPAIQYSGKLTHGRSDLSGKDVGGMMGSNGFNMMDREYFSGSLVETKKKESEEAAAEFPGLKRSSSYNADRSSKMDLVEKEIETVRAKCIPRKPRAVNRRETNPPISRSNLGSKRIVDEATQE